jgi:ribonuclease HI
MTYKIYTDGACSGNPGPGGYACVILSMENDTTQPIIITGYARHTTNNQMELLAVIHALLYCQIGSVVDIYSDSEYVVNGVNNYLKGWKKNNFKDIKNGSMWEELSKLLENHSANIHWVKAHNEDKYNEIADKSAKKAIELGQKGILKDVFTDIFSYLKR